MNYFLLKYGLRTCVGNFGAGTEEMPRGETKVCPDLFVMEYIQTLNIWYELNLAKEGKQRAPPSTCLAKKRVRVIYSEEDESNAWDMPFFGKVGNLPSTTHRKKT